VTTPWPAVALGDLTERVTTRDPGESGANEFTYIDIGSVDQANKAITGDVTMPVTEAPSRARQVVAGGDVLVSTVRPNLNAVAQVPPRLGGATASTGFAVLRPRPGRLDSRYLFHWVRHPSFVAEMVRLATGANYPAVTDRTVKASLITVPPVEEQRRIAAILDAADELRAKRRRALALLDTLTESVFLDMFGDPDAPWPIVRVDSLAADVHAIRTGPFGSQLLHSEFVSDGVAVLGIDNAVHDRFAWGRPRFITDEKFAQLRRYQVRPGDVLVTIMATCGRVAIVPDDIPPAINTKHLCCITLDRTRCLPAYLWAAFRFHPGLRRQLGATARGAVMPGLNMGLIKGATLPLPSIESQGHFADCLGKLESATASQSEHARQLEVLFASLQHCAFRGEL